MPEISGGDLVLVFMVIVGAIMLLATGGAVIYSSFKSIIRRKC